METRSAKRIAAALKEGAKRVRNSRTFLHILINLSEQLASFDDRFAFMFGALNKECNACQPFWENITVFLPRVRAPYHSPIVSISSLPLTAPTPWLNGTITLPPRLAKTKSMTVNLAFKYNGLVLQGCPSLESLKIDSFGDVNYETKPSLSTLSVEGSLTRLSLGNCYFAIEAIAALNRPLCIEMDTGIVYEEKRVQNADLDSDFESDVDYPPASALTMLVEIPGIKGVHCPAWNDIRALTRALQVFGDQVLQPDETNRFKIPKPVFFLPGSEEMFEYIVRNVLARGDGATLKLKTGVDCYASLPEELQARVKVLDIQSDNFPKRPLLDRLLQRGKNLTSCKLIMPPHMHINKMPPDIIQASVEQYGSEDLELEYTHFGFYGKYTDRFVNKVIE